MAIEDTKGKKRKGAPDAAPKAKKPRKSDDVAATTKPAKTAKAAKATSAPAESKPAKAKTSRKQAADFSSDDEAPAVEAAPAKAKATKTRGKAAPAEANGNVPEPAPPVVDEPKAAEKPKKQGKKAKAAPDKEAPVVEAPKEKAKKAGKGKKADAVPVEEEAPEDLPEEVPAKKSKKSKGSKKVDNPPTEDEDMADVAETASSKKSKNTKSSKKDAVAEPVAEADEVEVDAEEDDQTAALLAGFESEGDDEDPDVDDKFDKDLHMKKITLSKADRAVMADAEKNSKEPGVVYVGRIPRGFFEPQMKQYFSQFGKVRNLRLSRNKKTGASKHFAFVEFASPEVADIVARTMDNYLLFGHILKCKVVPNEQVHPDLFKDATSRFKVDPRNKKAGLEMERGVEREQWEKRVEKENKRRSGKAKALKEDFGYEFEAPKAKSVKTVKSVSKQAEKGEAQKLLAAEPAEEALEIEQPKPKRARKKVKA